MKNTLAAVLTIAVLAASATLATTTPSRAGYYGGQYGYGHGYRHKCFYKRIKVWGYYGYHWKRVRVCR